MRDEDMKWANAVRKARCQKCPVCKKNKTKTNQNKNPVSVKCEMVPGPILINSKCCFFSICSRKGYAYTSKTSRQAPVHSPASGGCLMSLLMWAFGRLHPGAIGAFIDGKSRHGALKSFWGTMRAAVITRKVGSTHNEPPGAHHSALTHCRSEPIQFQLTPAHSPIFF